MGLDMYAFGAVNNNNGLDVLPDIPEPLPAVKNAAGGEGHLLLRGKRYPYFPLAKWRKHPDLHGWMERLYRQRGGKGHFNCRAMRLHIDDIDALDRDLNAGSMPPPSPGYYMGKSDAQDLQQTRDFIANARTVINGGHAVFYDSYW